MPNLLQADLKTIPQTSAPPAQAQPTSVPPASSPSTNNQAAPSGSALDPQVVALSQAIRQVESNNNPTAVGKSGEYGAYQFEPATWAKYSAAAGVNVPLQQSSLQQQNQVAYTQIKKWKDEGYNVGQIASMWNAGEGAPNAYVTGNAGINGEGVGYDTKAYASQVAQLYQQFKGQGQSQGQTGYQPPTAPGNQGQTQTISDSSYAPPTPPPPTTQTTSQGPVVGQKTPSNPTGLPNGMGSFANVLSNLAKTPAAFAGAGNAVAPIVADIGNDIIGKNTKTFEQQSGDALKTAGNVGAIGATVASGGLLGPEAAAVLAPTSLAGLAGSGAALGAAQTAGTALQQNASAGQVASQGTMGALVGGVTGAAGYGLGKLLNAIGIKSATLAVRPSAGDFADGYDSQFAVDNGLTGNAQQVADKTKTFMQTLAAQLKNKLAGSNAGIDLAKVFDDTKAELTSQVGKESNFLQNSNLQGALSKLENEVLTVNPSGELPLLGAQTIKQQTGMYGEWLNGAPDPEANAMGTVANAFYRNLKSAIEDKFPTGEIADINGQLQKAIPIMRAAIRRVPVVARSSALSLTDMLGALGFSSNPATLALPAFQHAMNSGLISKVATPIANVIPKVAPVASSIMPGLLGKVLTQNK